METFLNSRVGQVYAYVSACLRLAFIITAKMFSMTLHRRQERDLFSTLADSDC